MSQVLIPPDSSIKKSMLPSDCSGTCRIMTPAVHHPSGILTYINGQSTRMPTAFPACSWTPTAHEANAASCRLEIGNKSSELFCGPL